MNHEKIVLTALLFLGTMVPAVAVSFQQNDTGKPKKGDVRTEDSKKSDQKKPKDSATVTIHVEVSNENMTLLPPDSTIELMGDEESCHQMQRPKKHILPEGVVFDGLQRCKIKLIIMIPDGSDHRTVRVDLRENDKKTIKIKLKNNGPPEVS